MRHLVVDRNGFTIPKKAAERRSSRSPWFASGFQDDIAKDRHRHQRLR
jgi:hypothetical protein